MERKEKVNKAIKWQKLGKKPITLLSGRIVQPGEIFMAEMSEIPQGFADLFMRVSEENPKPKEQSQNTPNNIAPGVQTQTPSEMGSQTSPVPDNQELDDNVDDELEEGKEEVKTTQPKFRIQHTNGGWYVVMDTTTGEPVDATNYRKPKAQEVADELNAIAAEE